ncbi:MerR family transcriptional regulator [Paramicrobacterium sp. CJ85]|uniref:MerR family transcriptional regulator n=1 Tax=Paramicrobacterium sp. CJ85 TaxID=3445355 RepID=UPI003F5D9B07
MRWSITEIAALTGTTSRTLRHYDHIGLLPPASIGANGYRYYDDASLVRLQRILLLRDLGLGLTTIAEVIEKEKDAPAALRTHLTWLRQESDRLARQIAAVEDTVHRLTKGEELMAEAMFDGFDHTQYKDEVETRWGEDAYARSDAWWTSMTESERSNWKAQLAALNADWTEAAERAVSPQGEEAQSLARRHVEWLDGVPGVPRAADGGLSREYLLGLADMYVADERFAENYGGQCGAKFVRDALHAFIENGGRES